MILADTLARVIAEHLGEHPDDAAKLTGAHLAAAPKFVFEQATARLAAEAIAAPEKVAAHIPLPGEITWLEFHLPTEKVGFLMNATGHPGGRSAEVLTVTLGHGVMHIKVATDVLDMDDGGLAAASRFNPLLMGALALLGVPALVERRTISQQKINKARARRGKPLLFDHEELRLHDLDLARPQARWNQSDSKPDRAGGPRYHQREHFKRAYLRFRKGQMELVRPHWRGDATLGRVAPAYRVKA